MGILIAITVGVAVLVAAGVQLGRYSKRVRLEADAALRELARALGTTFDPSRRSLAGMLNGRQCSLTELGLVRPGETDEHAVRIAVPLKVDLSFELHPQTSALGARLVGDVLVGDADFDARVIVRSSEVALVATALSAERRRPLADWLASGSLLRVWVIDGILHADCGYGLTSKKRVLEVQEIMVSLIGLAAALENIPR